MDQAAQIRFGIPLLVGEGAIYALTTIHCKQNHLVTLISPRPFELASIQASLGKN